MSKAKRKHKSKADRFLLERLFETMKQRDERTITSARNHGSFTIPKTAYEENIAAIETLLSGQYSDKEIATKVIDLMLKSFNQGVYAKEYIRHYITGTYRGDPREFPFSLDLHYYQQYLGLKKK